MVELVNSNDCSEVDEKGVRSGCNGRIATASGGNCKWLRAADCGAAIPADPILPCHVGPIPPLVLDAKSVEVGGAERPRLVRRGQLCCRFGGQLPSFDPGLQLLTE